MFVGVDLERVRGGGNIPVTLRCNQALPLSAMCNSVCLDRDWESWEI